MSKNKKKEDYVKLILSKQHDLPKRYGEDQGDTDKPCNAKNGAVQQPSGVAKKQG